MKYLIVFAALSLVACTDPSETIRVLSDEGYEEIEVTGYSFFECGKDDMSSTGFRAKNSKGKVVTGAVCCGLLKGCTVRH
jgi:hypothetical protein